MSAYKSRESVVRQRARVRKIRRRFELVLMSSLSEMPKVEQFLFKVNHALGLDEVQFNKLFLATSEAVTNAIIHGNKQDPDKKVAIVCEVGVRGVVVHVKDEGEGFDFNSLPHPLTEENLFKENGRGIFLMRTLMDKVRHRMTPAGTEVVMRLATAK